MVLALLWLISHVSFLYLHLVLGDIQQHILFSLEGKLSFRQLLVFLLFELNKK